MGTPATYTEFADRLNARQALRTELTSANNSLGHAKGHLDAAKRERIEARSTVQSARDSLARAEASGGGHAIERAKRELREFEDRLSSINQAVDRHQAEVSRLQARIGEIEAQLQAIDRERVERDQLVAHASGLAEQRRLVARIRSLIAERESLSDADTADEELGRLQAQRSELLADQALGKKNATALKDLDDQIARLTRDQDGTNAAALQSDRDRAQTVAGLHARLAAAESDLAQIEGRTQEVLRAWLRSQATGVYGMYLHCAQVVREAYVRLVAIDHLLVELGGEDPRRPPLLTSQHTNALLPAFSSLDMEDERLDDRARGIVFSGASVRSGSKESPSAVAQAIERELASIRKLSAEPLV